MESKITESKIMTIQKGIITLTILIFISGLLTAFLLLDDNHLSFFGRNKINENTMWKEHYNCKK